jgi:hypothetical protein
MFRSIRNSASLVFAAAGLVMAAQAPASYAQEAKTDKKAMSILKGMSDYLASATAVSFRARTFYDVVRESGIKIKVGREVRVRLRRPDRIQATAIRDDGDATTLWYDGKQFTVWRRSANQTMNLEIAGTTDQLLDELIQKYKVQMPLADLLYSNINETFSQDLISSEYLGIREVDGVPCHHLSFESKGADWQIWIEADATPVPRRFAIDFVPVDHQPQFLAQLDAWSVGGELEDYHFKAAVPEGVEKVTFEPAETNK